MAGLLVSAPVATVVACNVHELGHAAVGTIVGWEVERIDLCLPSGGAVVYARVGVWAGNVQGYAGGVTAAVFLFVTYLLVFARRAKPLQGPGWWFAGLGVVLWVGPQLVIGVLEGAVGPGEDYTRRYASVLLPSTSQRWQPVSPPTPGGGVTSGRNEPRGLFEPAHGCRSRQVPTPGSLCGGGNA